jgi:hypothetical protein
MINLLLRTIQPWTGLPIYPGSGSEKHEVVAEFGRRFRTPVLVETGTFRGDMVAAQKDKFERIFTIELNERLYRAAKARFAGDGHVQVLHGDSGTVLASCIENVEAPILYWLDGHYSGAGTSREAGETPIEMELRAIGRRNQPGDVVLIDDARLFGVRPGYPSIEELQQFVDQHLPGSKLTIESDIICILPAQEPDSTFRVSCAHSPIKSATS